MGHDSPDAALIYQHATRQADQAIADAVSAQVDAEQTRATRRTRRARPESAPDTPDNQDGDEDGGVSPARQR